MYFVVKIYHFGKTVLVEMLVSLEIMYTNVNTHFYAHANSINIVDLITPRSRPSEYNKGPFGK